VRKEFSKKVKEQVLERCTRDDGISYCEGCNLPFQGRIEFDHVLPDGLGGDNSLSNCQALCRRCHDHKSNRHLEGDKSKIAKADRIREKHLGIRKSKYRWGKRKW
jgi:5-methylcytosine-specific restriction endonuclease McrA